MAGVLKPNAALQEATYTHIGGSCWSGNLSALFDGSSGLADYNQGYIGKDTHYLEFSVSEPFHIWMLGDPAHPAASGALKLLKWDGSAYVDTGTLLTRSTVALTWTRSETSFPAGQYKAAYNGAYRIDAEWYFSKVTNDPIALHPAFAMSTEQAGWSVTSNAGGDANLMNAVDGKSTTRRVLSSAIVHAITITAPTGNTFQCAGFHRVGNADGNGPVVVEVYNGTTWVQVHSTVFNNATNAAYDASWEPVTGSAVRLSYTTASKGDTEELYFLAPADDDGKRSLVRDPSDGALKAFSGGSWTAVQVSGEPTAASYDGGMKTQILTGLTAANWAALGHGQLQLYTRQSTQTPLTSVFTAIPQDRIVYPTEDVNLKDVAQIESVTLTASTSGFGAVRVIASVDGGVTWKTWNGTTWETVAATPSVVLVSGMTPAALNVRAASDWTALRGASNRIRFAYGLRVVNATDVASVDTLAMVVDVSGNWVQYPGATVRWTPLEGRVQVTDSGSYKINWLRLK